MMRMSIPSLKVMTYLNYNKCMFKKLFPIQTKEDKKSNPKKKDTDKPQHSKKDKHKHKDDLSWIDEIEEWAAMK